MRQRGAALRCCCLALCLAASASGRGLLITSQQAQHALDTVTSAAGDIWGQAAQALGSSSLADDTMTPWQRNHTVEAINQRAPDWSTDWGYAIRPQLASALHNAENGWGPVNATFLRNTGAPAPAPAQASAAVSAETAPRLEGGRRLQQSYEAAPAAAPSAGSNYASSAAFAQLAAPDASVAGAAAPDLAQIPNAAAAPGPSTQLQSLPAQQSQLYTSYAAAAPGPSMQFQLLQPQQSQLYTQYAAAAPGPSMQFQSLQQSQPYTSFAATNQHKRDAAEAQDTTGSPVAIAQAEGTSAQQSTASAVPAGASSASQQGASSLGAQVPAQAGQAASAGYPAQQGVLSAKSSAQLQGSQGGSSGQGLQYGGTTVPAQQSVARTGGVAAQMASTSAAKAAQQPVQGQAAQSPSAAAKYTPPSTGAVTLQNGGLQPKTGQGGVSLDPNQPNRLPGMLRQADFIQQKQDGYSPPVTPTSATEGTAFAGTPVQNLPGPLQVTASSPLDGPSVAGSEISLITGVRISTPFFGTGFNFCVDRYFGSFPKVGIVIPNIAQWLLPELQDIAKTLQTTLQLPPDATIGHGLTLEPSSDGLLLTFPTVQPNNIPDVGIRYGIQIGQVFGYDFGIGIIRDICFITFVTV